MSYHEENKTKVHRHADDFASEGTRRQAKEFEQALLEHLLVKHRGNLGPERARGDVQEFRVLHRILRWMRPPYGKGQECIELEADPRRAEILMQQCGLDHNSNSVTTPGGKRTLATTEELVEHADRTVYRSFVRRLCYLAANRVGIQFAAKALVRSMQKPTPSDFEAVKRCGRYLVRYPRLV